MSTLAVVPLAAPSAGNVTRMAEPKASLVDAGKLAIPITLAVSILGGALLIQARLMGVEHAVDNVRQEIARRDELYSERLHQFSVSLRELNPTLKVPDIR